MGLKVELFFSELHKMKVHGLTLRHLSGCFFNTCMQHIYLFLCPFQSSHLTKTESSNQLALRVSLDYALFAFGLVCFLPMPITPLTGHSQIC